MSAYEIQCLTRAVGQLQEELRANRGELAGLRAELAGARAEIACRSDDLNEIATAIRDLTAALTAPRRPAWRRWFRRPEGSR